LTDLAAIDPELTVLRDTAALLDDPGLVTPALKLMENAAVNEALRQADADAEGPLPFISRMIQGDTVESALRTVDLLLTAISE
ncbi:MAG: hypothetical protein AAFV53_30775, partial [Myxococcota bacterium]